MPDVGGWLRQLESRYKLVEINLIQQGTKRDEFLNKYLYESFVKPLRIKTKNLVVLSQYDPVNLDWRWDSTYFGFFCVNRLFKAHYVQQANITFEELRNSKITINEWLQKKVEAGEFVSPCYRIDYERNCVEALCNVYGNLNFEKLDVSSLSLFDFPKYIEITGKFIKTFIGNKTLEEPHRFAYIFPILRGRLIFGVAFIYCQELVIEEQVVNLSEKLNQLFNEIVYQYFVQSLLRSRKHALKSSVTAIMARNKSHIHGSHIEHGLRNKMHTFEARLLERLCSEESFYENLRKALSVKCDDIACETECRNDNKEVKKKSCCAYKATVVDFSEISNNAAVAANKVKLAILMEHLKEEAHKQMSFYRQRQDDLAARVATEWPMWGVALDLFAHIVSPILQNPFILHFINLSENYCLKNIELKFGNAQDISKIKWIKERFEGNIGQKTDIDLIDHALFLSTGISDIEVLEENIKYPLNIYLQSKWKLKYEDRDPCLVHMRDADIGAQAFFALFEGIIRNASKHGALDTSAVHEKNFRIRIVFCKNWAQVISFVDFGDKIYEQDSNRYSFVIISAGRDLICADKPVVESLRGKFSENIIDESGKIRSGAWGIKEMKICSAFVAGQTIDSVNSNSPDYIMIGETKSNFLWEDDKKRLCYVIRIEKPKIALAVIPEEKISKDQQDKWEGIRFVTNVTNIFKEHVDYDFLYIDKSIEVKMAEVIKEYSYALPQRVVHDDINFNDINDHQRSLNYEVTLYDKLINSEEFKKKYQINIANKKFSIYFEDRNIATEWRSQCKGHLPITFHENKPESIPQNDEIAIWRHIKINDTSMGLPQCSRSQGPYYYQHVSGSEQFFNFLLSIRPETNPELANLVLWQIIESTLLNVLIVDERIHGALLHLKSPDEPEISLAEKLYWMGISVAKTIKVGDKQIWPAANSDEQTEQATVKAMEKEIRMADYVLTTDVMDVTNVEIPIHILFIHATRLNGIYEEVKDKLSGTNDDDKRNDLINRLRLRIPHIVIHSGRGKTEGDIPKNAPFVEYSTLEKYVISEPSKFYLTQIALSAEGIKE